jgi:hypothetical protein
MKKQRIDSGSWKGNKKAMDIIEEVARIHNIGFTAS